MEENKVCSKCGESLPISCFNKDKQKRCGLTGSCRGLVWEIDHIKPVVKFDRNESPAVVNALSNIRPLWKIDNLKKKDKWLT